MEANNTYQNSVTLSSRSSFGLGFLSAFLLMGTVGFFLLGAYVVKGGTVTLAMNDSKNSESQGTDGAAGDTGNAAAAPTAAAPTAAAPTVPAGTVPEVTAADHVSGSADAPVTMVVYSDFECPYCSRFHPTMQQVISDYAGKVKVVFRNFPLSFHAEAKPAAEAAECAGQQGKFFEYATKLFENQSDLGTELYTKLAQDLGIDTTKFQSCLDSDVMLAKITSDSSGGAAAGISGTPGSFIIGKDGTTQQIKGALPFESVKSVIDGMLAK